MTLRVKHFFSGAAVILVAHGATYPNSPDSSPPEQWSEMHKKFTRHCSPFGVSIFAQGWPENKFHHACNMLAQFIDNDQDGCADDIEVVQSMRALQSGMVMFKTQNDVKKNAKYVASSMNWQDLYAEETFMECSGSGETENCRDAAIEEIFHVLSAHGIGPVYASKFSDCPNSIGDLSEMQIAMDVARGGHFESVPKKYPSEAIYHYNDRTCTYDCQGTEMFYWALTSLLNGQDSRANDNMEEWEASTPSQLLDKLPSMYDLLINGNKMKLLSLNGVLPGTNSATGATGTYNPSSQTCSSGCGLDGKSGSNECGALGSQNESPAKCVLRAKCEDDPDFRVKNKAGKSCDWVGEKPSQRCRQPGAIKNCKVACDVCDKNGEEVCEGSNLKKKSCQKVGCCSWGGGKCWSGVGTSQCYEIVEDQRQQRKSSYIFPSLRAS